VLRLIAEEMHEFEKQLRHRESAVPDKAATPASEADQSNVGSADFTESVITHQRELEGQLGTGDAGWAHGGGPSDDDAHEADDSRKNGRQPAIKMNPFEISKVGRTFSACIVKLLIMEH
jgi:hypothetical protein